MENQNKFVITTGGTMAMYLYAFGSLLFAVEFLFVIIKLISVGFANLFVQWGPVAIFGGFILPPWFIAYSIAYYKSNKIEIINDKLNASIFNRDFRHKSLYWPAVKKYSIELAGAKSITLIPSALRIEMKQGVTHSLSTTPFSERDISKLLAVLREKGLSINIQGKRLNEKMIKEETTQMNYAGAAMKRAERSKSPWNILALLFGLVAFVSIGYHLAKWIIYYFQPSNMPFRKIADGHDLQMIFVTIPLLFMSFPWGLMVGNIIVWLIPPARRVLDKEAEGYPGTSFKESQAKLFKIAIILSIICLPIAIYAASRIKI